MCFKFYYHYDTKDNNKSHFFGHSLGQPTKIPWNVAFGFRTLLC